MVEGEGGNKLSKDARKVDLLDRGIPKNRFM